MDEPWIIIAMLGAVIFMFSFIRSKAAGRGAASTDVVREMEETFEHFAKELEDDNRELMQRISEMKTQFETQIRGLQERIRLLEQELRSVEQRKTERVVAGRVKRPAPQAQRPAPQVAGDPGSAGETVATVTREPTEIGERYRQIVDWHAQGKSMEYIAKKMEMNKGEVQLILKLAEQEELLRAEK